LGGVCGVEILFEMVRVTCTSVVGGSGGGGGNGGSGASGGESRGARACADRLVISSEGWNEVISLNGQLLQASLQRPLHPPLPAIGLSHSPTVRSSKQDHTLQLHTARRNLDQARPPSPRAFPRKPQS
jgi:hypothetical protein